MEGGAAGGAAGEGAGRPGLTLLLLTLQLQFLLQLLLQFLLPHLFRPGLVVKMFIKFYKYIFSIRKVIEINILVVFRVNLVGRLCGTSRAKTTIQGFLQPPCIGGRCGGKRPALAPRLRSARGAAGRHTAAEALQSGPGLTIAGQKGATTSGGVVWLWSVCLGTEDWKGSVW